MAWPISITAEGWQNIYNQLGTWKRQDLVDAICQDRFDEVLEKAGQKHADRAMDAHRERLQHLPHDVLVDLAYELVEKNDTCDNGGWHFWVDREGYYRVDLPDDEC